MATSIPKLEITPASRAMLQATLVLLRSRLKEHTLLAEQINARTEELQQGMNAIELRINELEEILKDVVETEP